MAQSPLSRIHHPPRPSPKQASQSTTLIYLPRGPYMPVEQDDASTISTLRSGLQCTIVQINYRLSRERKYPTPIHDVLCGWDWILENLLPKRAITRAGRSESVGKLAVCGELIGGSLATMLALTECRIGQPGVVAAAVNNPIVDWVSLTRPTSESKGTSKSDPGLLSAPDAEPKQLVSLRSQLFARPDGYFDPFASPMLFFRSAGVGVPPAPVAAYEDDMERLSRLSREQSALDEDINGAAVGSSDDGDGQESSVTRKVSRRFPNSTLRLRLPKFHVSTGSASPFRDQTAEFIKQLGKSMARQHSRSDFGHKITYEDEEDVNSGLPDVLDRVQSKVYDEDGLWDDSVSGRERVLEVTKWLKNAIE